jgi:hypothetical protein
MFYNTFIIGHSLTSVYKILEDFIMHFMQFIFYLLFSY